MPPLSISEWYGEFLNLYTRLKLTNDCIYDLTADLSQCAWKPTRKDLKPAKPFFRSSFNEDS